MYNVTVRVTDILLFAYFLLVLLHRNVPIDWLSLWMYSLFVSIYICIRNLLKYQKIVISLGICLGVIEASIAIMQRLNLLENYNKFYSVAGTFENPAELGGFLSICMTLCVGFLLQCRKENSWGINVFLLFISAIVFGGLLFSDSRASWLGAIVGSLFLVVSLSAKAVLGLRKHFSYIPFMKEILFFVIAILFYSIYLYKKDSADGRFLVWRATMDMICENPLFGRGTGGWQADYMHYQADYFNEHPDSSYNMLADNVACPYNEYLLVLADYGIIGLILIILLLYFFLSYKPNSKTEVFLKACLLSIMTFAFFSYPSKMLALMLSIFVVLGGLKSKELVRFHISRSIYLPFFLCFFSGMGLLSLWSFNMYSRCRLEVYHLLYNKNICKSKQDFLDSHYLLYCFNPAVMDAYARFSFQNHSSAKAERILLATATLTPSCEIYCDMGELFERKGDYKNAEECYREAINMIPSRITPKYRLFQMYAIKGDTVMACKMAADLLESPAKKEGTKTLRMRAVAKEYLQNATCVEPR